MRLHSLARGAKECGWLSTGLAVAQKVEGTNQQKITSHVRQLFLTMRKCFTSCSAWDGLLGMTLETATHYFGREQHLVKC